MIFYPVMEIFLVLHHTGFICMYIHSFGLLECLFVLLTLPIEIIFLQRYISTKAVIIRNSVELFKNCIDATSTLYQCLMWDLKSLLKHGMPKVVVDLMY